MPEIARQTADISPMEATVIVNPASRSGLKIFHSMEKCISPFFACDIKFTERRGHAAGLAREAAGRALIVCGGDGTLNEVANGLAGRTDIAVAPTWGGSGCDLSRLFHIKKRAADRVREIYDRLSSGRVTKMRLSLVEADGRGRFFVGVGDAGFGATVAGLFDRFRRLGKLGYVAGVIQALARTSPVRTEVLVDGKKQTEPALMIMFARSRFYAGGMLVSPNSDPFSDSARMIFLKGMGKLTLLYYFPRIYWGGHLKIKYVEEREVRELRINTPGLPIDVEGEYVGRTPCVFSITDKYISVV